MLVTMPRETVEQLWRALEKPDMGSRPHVAAEIGRAAAAAGWIAHLELEAVLLALEPRLAEIRTQHLLDAFGIRGQWVHPRPRGRDAGVLGVERVAAVDAAHLLILLERLGFAVDPAPLCAPLLPVLKTRPYLTDAELAVFWHDRKRHRMEPLEVTADTRPAWGEPDQAPRTEAGYRVAMFRGADDRPSALRVTAPGHQGSRSEMPLRRAIEAVGGVTKLARALGISHQAILKWRRLPAERVLDVERETGVSRYDLRPDLYGPAPIRRTAA